MSKSDVIQELNQAVMSWADGVDGAVASPTRNFQTFDPVDFNVLETQTAFPEIVLGGAGVIGVIHWLVERGRRKQKAKQESTAYLLTTLKKLNPEYSKKSDALKHELKSVVTTHIKFANEISLDKGMSIDIADREGSLKIIVKDKESKLSPYKQYRRWMLERKISHTYKAMVDKTHRMVLDDQQKLLSKDIKEIISKNAITPCAQTSINPLVIDGSLEIHVEAPSFPEPALNKFEKLYQRHILNGKVSSLIRGIFNGLKQYALLYWIGWWVTFMVGATVLAASTTTVLGVALSFGLPALLPLGLLARHIYKHFKNGDQSPQPTDNAVEIRHNLSRALFAKAYFDRYQNELSDKKSLFCKNFPNLGERLTNTKLPAAPESKPSSIVKENVISSKSKRIAFAVITGLVVGYVLVSAVAWPLTALLSTSFFPLLVNSSAVISKVLFGLGIGAGIHWSLKNSVQASISHKKVSSSFERKSEILAKIEDLKQFNSELREKVEEQRYTLNKQNISESDLPSLPAENMAYNERAFRYLSDEKPGHATLFKKLAIRAKNFLFNSWSGLFVARSLFAAGGIIALSSGIALPIIGIAAAVIWGSYKVAEYSFNRKIEKEEKSTLKEAEARLYAMQRESEILNHHHQFNESLIEESKPKVSVVVAPAILPTPSPVATISPVSSDSDSRASTPRKELPSKSAPLPALIKEWGRRSASQACNTSAVMPISVSRYEVVH